MSKKIVEKGIKGYSRITQGYEVCGKISASDTGVSIFTPPSLYYYNTELGVDCLDDLIDSLIEFRDELYDNMRYDMDRRE